MQYNPYLPGTPVKDASFPVHFVSVSNFLRFGSIMKHETLKAKGQIKTFPLVEMANDPRIHQRLIFVSHRWVGNSPDDSKNSQYKYICDMMKKFQNPDEFYLWIDYCSMPQDNQDEKLRTIHLLNNILSHCMYTMIVLLDSDPEGKEYVQRVWCFYEWTASIQYGKVPILRNPRVGKSLYSHAYKTIRLICEEGALNFLEQAKAQYGPHAMNVIQNVVVEDDIFNKKAFCRVLQASFEKDKETLFQNVKACLSLSSILFLESFSQGHFQTIYFEK